MKQRTLEFEPGDLVYEDILPTHRGSIGIVTESSFYYKNLNGTRAKVWLTDVYWPTDGTTRTIKQHWLSHYKPENS